ncbi:hypothetical protein JCM13304A_13280 [Desulfothermus okinawensis JCM 13304]
MQNRIRVPKEQNIYAEILFFGCWGGIAIMCITYFLYLSTIMDPFVPMDTLQKMWHLPSGQFMEKLNIHQGWSWVHLLGKGDFINFIGIALLGLLTIVGYFTLAFAYFKRGDMVYTFIAIFEILVLLLAASGILGSGGH